MLQQETSIPSVVVGWLVFNKNVEASATPGRGYCRFLKFCMGSKNIRITIKDKNREPPYPQNVQFLGGKLTNKLASTTFDENLDGRFLSRQVRRPPGNVFIQKW